VDRHRGERLGEVRREPGLGIEYATRLVRHGVVDRHELGPRPLPGLLAGLPEPRLRRVLHGVRSQDLHRVELPPRAADAVAEADEAAPGEPLELFLHDARRELPLRQRAEQSPDADVPPPLPHAPRELADEDASLLREERGVRGRRRLHLDGVDAPRRPRGALLPALRAERDPPAHALPQRAAGLPFAPDEARFELPATVRHHASATTGTGAWGRPGRFFPSTTTSEAGSSCARSRVVGAVRMNWERVPRRKRPT